MQTKARMRAWETRCSMKQRKRIMASNNHNSSLHFSPFLHPFIMGFTLHHFITGLCMPLFSVFASYCTLFLRPHGSVYFSAIQMALISKQYVLWEIACHVQKSNYIPASVFGFGRNDTEILKHSWWPFMPSKVTAYYSKSRSTSPTGPVLSRHGVGQY